MPPGYPASSWVLGTRRPPDFYPQAPPFSEGINNLLVALEQADAWPTFETRILLKGNAEDQPETTFYLHLEGSFAGDALPMQRQHASPEIMAGRLAASTVREALRSWGQGRALVLEGRNYVLPIENMGALVPSDSTLHDQSHLRLLGADYFPTTGLPGLTIGWTITASSIGGDAQDTIVQTEFLGAAYQSGSTSREYSLHHLGRDYSHFNSPVVTILLPLPLVFGTTVDEDDVVGELWLRPPLAHESFWMAVGSGPWDLRRDRRTDWALDAPDACAWTRGERRFLGSATPPEVMTWVGRDDDPEISAKLRVLPSGAAVQRGIALAMLVGAVPLADALQPSPDARGNVAQKFELAVANTLGSLGYACINVGIPVKAEGLDMLAFHDNRQECLLISVTTTGDISRKLSGLLRRRTDVVPSLPAWRCRLVVVTPVVRDHLAPADLRDFKSKGVGVVTGSELRYAVADMPTLKDQLDDLLDAVPWATI